MPLNGITDNVIKLFEDRFEILQPVTQRVCLVNFIVLLLKSNEPNQKLSHEILLVWVEWSGCSLNYLPNQPLFIFHTLGSIKYITKLNYCFNKPNWLRTRTKFFCWNLKKKNFLLNFFQDYPGRSHPSLRRQLPDFLRRFWIWRKIWFSERSYFKSSKHGRHFEQHQQDVGKVDHEINFLLINLLWGKVTIPTLFVSKL